MSLNAVRLSAVTLGVVLAALAGCDSGSKRFGVSGTVKYKGEPVKAGSINFRADNGDAGGAQITDGQYSVPASAGMPAGKYKVSISYPDPKTVPKASPDVLPGESAPAKELLPAKYNEKSELTAEIKAQASNDVSFDLK